MAKVKVLEAEEGYDLYARNYDKKLNFLNSFERDVLKKMFRRVGQDFWAEGLKRGSGNDLKILDAGCGTGRLMPILMNFGPADFAPSIIAMDVSEAMLKILRKKYPRINGIQGQIADMPFADGEFDLVVASFVIVHLKNPEAAFSEVARVLREGGEFIVTNINQRKAPKLNYGEGQMLIRSYYHRPDKVREALEDNFFEILEEEFVNERGGEHWINQVLRVKKR